MFKGFAGMPDVARSDSQRSNTSLRPRVSFNRDVHIKRIVPRNRSRPLNGNVIRKERLKKTKKELQEEAARVIHQADKINCISADREASPEKFYTLPRSRRRPQDHRTSSLERKVGPTPSSSISSPPPGRKHRRHQKRAEPGKSNLRRSTSDISDLTSADSGKRKPLSPIIENTQSHDHFTKHSPTLANNRINKHYQSPLYSNNNNNSDATRILNEYIEEIDNELYNLRDGAQLKELLADEQRQKQPEIVVIDVDKAVVSGGKKGSTLKAKLRALTHYGGPVNEGGKEARWVSGKEGAAMIHSSQKPVERLPLTKGQTVGSMVRLLSRDPQTPPPPPPQQSALIQPNYSVQHNNNRPFSYTRGLSPEAERPPAATRPVIYAQVVCPAGGAAKQTVHAEIGGGGSGGRARRQSDSDEGLGCEDSSTERQRRFTRFGDSAEEDPITPQLRAAAPPAAADAFDGARRGRADGMDARVRREDDGPRRDLSARRDLLESRINRRLNDKLRLSQPMAVVHHERDTASSPLRQRLEGQAEQRRRPSDLFDADPKSFDSQVSDYRSSPENRFDNRSKYISSKYNGLEKGHYKSTPEIYHGRSSFEERTLRYEDSYHDSLRREKHEKVFVVGSSTKYAYDQSERKDKFGDSGIENDFRRDSADNLKIPKPFANDSEDEGFASSLLIPADRKGADEGMRDPRVPHQNYNGHQSAAEYVPRERSIDDGAYFDPRLDKDVCARSGTLKKVESKPPKPEKKSGLDKVKQLFSRDSNKKKGKHGLVREESLRARYREYKGSTEGLDDKSQESTALTTSAHRWRPSTPTSSATRDRRPQGKPVESHSWFKSLDRLSRKKTKKEPPAQDGAAPSAEEKAARAPPPPKSLRFFGDTDADSSDNGSRQRDRQRGDRTKSQSTRELHNIAEEQRGPNAMLRRAANHRSLTNIASRPQTRGRRDARDESSTEGEGSQQSQRSVVYLHAATVGDIPGPQRVRAASREELAGGRTAPQMRTLSRSFSMLAPWRPRRRVPERDVDYSGAPPRPANNRYEQQRPPSSSSRKEGPSTLKRHAHDGRRLPTLGGEGRTATMALYKKKERLPRENSRYGERRMAAKSQSVESLRNHHHHHRDKRDAVARSMSMPKNSEKAAGWFGKKKH